MKKLYIITLCVILLALVSCNSKLGESVPTHFPYKVNSTDRWGLVDVKGKSLVKDEFKNEPSAVIEEMFFVQNMGEYEIYSINNPKREVVEEKFVDIAYYSEGLAPCVKKNEGIKYIDKRGKVKFGLPLEYLYAKKFENGYSLIGRKAKLDSGIQTYGETPLLQWDAVNSKGDITKFDKYSIERVLSNGNFLVHEMDFHGKNDYCILNPNGTVKTILKGYDPDLAELGDIISPDLKYYVYYDDEEDTYGIRNMGGVTVLKARYEWLVFLKNGKLAFYEGEDKIDGGMGVIDIKGNVLIKPKYKWITLHDDDKYLVLRDDKMALLNSNEDRLIDYKFEFLQGLSEKEFVAFDEDDRYRLISMDGKTIASFSDFNTVENKYYVVKSNYFDAEDCIKTFMNSVESLYGLFGLTLKDCADKKRFDISAADITSDNWIPEQFLQQSDYGKIYYSLGFEKILECYEALDGFYYSEICDFSDKPCGGIKANLQFNSETYGRYEEIEKQLEKVLFDLGYSSTSKQGNQMYSRSGIDIVRITVNARELYVKVYNEYLSPTQNNASLSPGFHQQNNSDASQFVVIDGSQLRLRLGPTTSSGTFKWPDGTNRHPNVGDKYRYLGESGDFYKIDFDGNELWVSKQYSHLE